MGRWEAESEFNIKEAVMALKRAFLLINIIGLSMASWAECILTCTVDVPPYTEVGAETLFKGTTIAEGCIEPVHYTWDFGDGTPPATTSQATHAYSTSNRFDWVFTASADEGISCSQSGSINVSYGGGMPGQMQMLFLVHTPGDKGSQWRSSLTVTNWTSLFAGVVASYTSQSGSITKYFELTENQSRRWDDAARDLFNVPGDSLGVLRIWSRDYVNVQTRIYNASGGGTTGQSFYAIGTEGASYEGRIPGLLNSAQFRSNVGFINPNPDEMVIGLGIYNDDGGQVGTWIFQTIPAYGWIQINDVFAQCRAKDVPAGHIRIIKQDFTDRKYWGYGSVVDNITNDPTSLPMVEGLH